MKIGESMKKSEKIIAAIVALVIISFGIYMTFFDGNVSKYDSKTNAYKVDVNEYYDSDSGTMYNTKLRTIPSNIIAGMLHLQDQPLFTVESEEAAKNVKVDFNK